MNHPITVDKPVTRPAIPRLLEKNARLDHEDRIIAEATMFTAVLPRKGWRHEDTTLAGAIKAGTMAATTDNAMGLSVMIYAISAPFQAYVGSITKDGIWTERNKK